jgi:hypothetical protein
MDQPANEWQRQQGHHRQGGVDGEQNDRRHHNHQHVGGKVQQVQGQEHVDAVGLVADAGDQVTGAAIAEILQRQLEQMFVGGGAQVRADALGHQRQYVGLGPAQDPGEQSGAEQAQQVHGHQRRIDRRTVLVRDQDVVHQGHGQVRRHQGGRGRCQREDKTAQQGPLVGLGKTPELEQGPGGWGCQVFAAAAGAFVIVLAHDRLAHRADRDRQGFLQWLAITGQLSHLVFKLADPTGHSRLQTQSEAPDTQPTARMGQLQGPHTRMVTQFQAQIGLQGPTLPTFFCMTGR